MENMLTLIACYITSLAHANIILHNMNILQKYSKKLIIINKSGKFKEYIISKISCEWYDIRNDKFVDIGSYYYGLQKINYKEYDYVLLTNDSFYLNRDIPDFFEMVSKNNKLLYGMTNSYQNKFHIMSFFRLFPSKHIPIFINYFEKYSKLPMNTDPYHWLIYIFEIGFCNDLNLSNTKSLYCVSLDKRRKKKHLITNNTFHNFYMEYLNNGYPIIKLKNIHTLKKFILENDIKLLLPLIKN